MPNWNQILNEIRVSGSTYDQIRRKYLKRLHNLTKRNTIIYYSGWLQKSGVTGTDINDADKNAFMTVIHNLDRPKGLDLLLHTPGGDSAATESLVEYLRAMFGTDIRVIVPQIAMSAGTMIACSAKTIIMGQHSSLGPIDPQLNGLPAHGVIEEFQRAYREIKEDASKIPIWQPIIAKYLPTFIGECEKSIEWSEEMTRNWLITGMLKDSPERDKVADKIILELADHSLTKSHARHISMDQCREIGLKVEALEDDPKLQDAVLSVHHACIHTLDATNAIKLVENHLGTSFILSVQRQVIATV